MNSAPTAGTGRVLSGMRPTGALHIGNYHGALRNWVALQHHHECYFFIADWHALTTDYENPALLQKHVHEMVIDWPAAGLDPRSARSSCSRRCLRMRNCTCCCRMITPLSWLERVPTYKDQRRRSSRKRISPPTVSWGIRCAECRHPHLPSAYVPVGEDQVAHVEMTREVARRFNHIYGRDPAFPKKVKAALGKLGPAEVREQYQALRRGFQEGGEAESLHRARQMVQDCQRLADERELLLANRRANTTGCCRRRKCCSRRRPRCPASTAERCRSPTAIRCVSPKNRSRSTGRSAPWPPTRRGCGAPIRARREVPGVGSAQAVFQRGDPRTGAAGLHHGGHRVRMQKPVIERICADATAMRERAAPYLANPRACARYWMPARSARMPRPRPRCRWCGAR
ncbi:MAG: hypothetical protein U1F39_04720 [Steroidobacteraceae bacterium]